MGYAIENEYVNIDKYSPYWFVNEVSRKYQFKKFNLPFIDFGGRKIPVHPDTFDDLKLKKSNISYLEEVFPTSSFRTVYWPRADVFLKLPLLRVITRGLRDLSDKQIDRAEAAGKALGELECKNFSFLPEFGFKAGDPNFNFIMRPLPKRDLRPWFSVIKSQDYSKSFGEKVLKNIIHSWMFFASNDLYLEYHTQNVLVDKEGRVYYRDLSDVKSVNNIHLQPSYLYKLNKLSDISSVIFDRAVCNQNLDHFFRYDTKGVSNEKIKEFIKEKVEEFGIEFPNYSFDFPKNKPERVPERVKLVSWRS